ncbi:3-dehydroquinase [Haloferula helveola]|uniref:3-dehydroquinate dehydratase n=1 Tax=Haloferula helveola TaxID=490095 RepID=A0ABN6GZ60_9BACT|nr:3-dehydroquinase [Haloferula helveola]
MARSPLVLESGRPLVVGSIGNSENLERVSPEEASEACDLVEIRLDLLDPNTIGEKPWRKFAELPLLFTARCQTEGGAAGLTPDDRVKRVLAALDDASLVDIELASASTMRPLLGELEKRGIPWVASFHDFHGVPSISELSARSKAARQAGAAAFKAAIELGWRMEQLGPLALFLQRSGDYPVSLMGMGPLAPVSRVLFAQVGSVLNYGYLGNAPTAPGQWSALRLKEAIESVQKAG